MWASLLALLTDWVLHSFPDPDGFAMSRALRLFLSHEEPNTAPTDSLGLAIEAIAPMLVALFASWLTGSVVAGWYVRKTSEL